MLVVTRAGWRQALMTGDCRMKARAKRQTKASRGRRQVLVGLCEQVELLLLQTERVAGAALVDEIAAVSDRLNAAVRA